MLLTVRRTSGVVSTDDILPARYKHASTDPHELAAHLFEAREPGLAERLENTIVVGDDIFGLGSSREQAVTALSAAGVAAVVAPAFGRIFYRNCWNNAVPAIECDTTTMTDGATVDFDVTAGTIRTGDTVVRFSPPDGWIHSILAAGGLLAWVKEVSTDA